MSCFEPTVQVMHMIETQDLTKHFTTQSGTVEAVRGIDLDVGDGELVALLGPNGAGKSTTLRMLTSLLAPTAGTAVVAGYDVTTHPAEVRRRIGYVGQGNGAGHSQRVRDELVTQGRCYGLDRRTSTARADELLEALELTTLAKRTVSTLSGGQRRRVDVALGLVHRPGLLFLDEPSTGLDPQNRANLWDHIARLRAEHGMTIVVTTHYLDEADGMAERVVVVDHGRVIADDTPDQLKADLAGDRITLRFADDRSAASGATIAERTAPGAAVIADGPFVVVNARDGAERVPGLLRALDAAALDVRSAEVRRPSLDDVFLALTGRSLREEHADPEPEPDLEAVPAPEPALASR